MSQPSSEPLRDRMCVVTGANAGMVKATAWALAGLGATVVMVCRDRGRAKRTRRKSARSTRRRIFQW